MFQKPPSPSCRAVSAALPLTLAAAFTAASTAITAAQERLTEHTLTLDESAKGPEATIADAAWLAGRWVGEGLGGTLEETWSPALGGAMVATFRLVRGDDPSFYEICLLAEDKGSLCYKVKHFHADLTGWEEKTYS